MAEMTQEEMVQEVLDRVLQSSTGVEDLETVTSLNGVFLIPVAVKYFKGQPMGLNSVGAYVRIGIRGIEFRE